MSTGELQCVQPLVGLRSSEGNTQGSSIVVQLLHDHIEGSTGKANFNLLIHGNVREDAHQGVT